jgi:RNA polymerase-binding transcription factor DksA
MRTMTNPAGIGTEPSLAGHRRKAPPATPNRMEGTKYVTSTVHDPIEVLGNTLEEQFQWHADQLAQLTEYSQQPDRGGYDDNVLAELIAISRNAVADTAQALRRMADGSYGICEHCTADIPLQRLEILPHARFCVPCQRKRTG